MIKILGYDDSVTSCECCGKSNLKSTVIVDVDGEIMHYGSTCATRHTGVSSGGIKKAINDLLQAKKQAAHAEYYASSEEIAFQNKAKIAYGMRLIGRAFKEFCSAELLAMDSKKAEIAQKHGLSHFSF